MNLQEFINNQVQAARQETLAHSDQLTLGEMILKLEPIVARQKDRIADGREEAVVRYDFGGLFPTEIDSWRGSYAELALNHVDAGEYLRVSAFLQLLKDTVGKEFTGYKGGEFTMNKHTPVWVDNYGKANNTAVVEIVDNGWEVIIMTGYREY